MRWKRVIVALAAVGLLAASPIVYGMLAQAWAVAHDSVATSRPAGRLLRVGRHTMHLDCLGETAGPTVVLESGVATDQPELVIEAITDLLAAHRRTSETT